METIFRVTGPLCGEFNGHCDDQLNNGLKYKADVWFASRESFWKIICYIQAYAIVKYDFSVTEIIITAQKLFY